MSSVAEMVEAVLLQVEGWSGDQSVFGTLHAGIDADDASFTVDGPVMPDGSGMSPGLVEIGNELCYVQAVNRSTGVLSGVLRGWRGTTAATHATGALVRANPLYPRIAVLRAINQTISSVWPRLYGVASSTFSTDTFNPVYALPYADGVLQVSWNDGLTSMQAPSRMYMFDKQRNQLEVLDAPPNATLKVIYSRQPVTVGWADSFTATLLPAYCEEAVLAGATVRLLQGAMLLNMPVPVVEQTQIAQSGVQLGNIGSNAIKVFAAAAEQRLQEAERQLAAQYPAPVHRRW